MEVNRETEKWRESPDLRQTARNTLSHRFAVAPMMDWGDSAGFTLSDQQLKRFGARLRCTIVGLGAGKVGFLIP